ncbi:MAG: amidase [Anaerolineae bacterium]|nr:amidase [Anaerolineae bacterium]
MSEQTDRQYNTPAYQGQRPLDFAPFTDALENLSDAHREELDRLLDGCTIPGIQQLFADGKLTTLELATCYIDRIHRYQSLNAVLELNPDALEIAADLDAERAAGKSRGPLHGIPVLLKDNIATGDRMHTTAGAKALENAHADRDSSIAMRLRSAGALILGKGNLSEWANYMTSQSANGFSVLGGQTRCPYGRFDVSGSSSGSAVAVASNLVTVAVGTETSGSLISPASQNSVVTLKPSLGLISQDRIIPITAAQDTAGPMARSVTDLPLLLNVLAGSNADNHHHELTPLFELDFTTCLDASSLQGRRLGLVQHEKEIRPGDFVVQEQALAALESAGAEVVPVDFPLQPVDYLPVLDYGMKVGLDAYLQATGAPFATLAEIVAFNAEDLPNRAPFGQDLLEKVLACSLTAEEYEEMVHTNRTITGNIIRETLTDNGLDLLMSLNNYATAVYAPAGYPALSVPAGYRDNGEPIGLTFFGNYADDARVVRAAYAFEQATHARRSPALSG